MRLSRTSRYLATLLAVFSLLFTQLALAGYACPDLMAGGQAGAVTASDAMAAMPGCKIVDPVQPNLCHAHGHTVHQSTDKPDAPQVAPLALGPVLFALVPLSSASRIASQREAPSLLRSTSPPLAIRHCCFRI